MDSKKESNEIKPLPPPDRIDPMRKLPERHIDLLRKVNRLCEGIKITGVLSKLYNDNSKTIMMLNDLDKLSEEIRNCLLEIGVIK